MFRRYKLKNFDFLLVLLVIALNVIGILAIGSAKQSVQSKQILGMAVGLIAMLVIAFLDYSRLLKLAWIRGGMIKRTASNSTRIVLNRSLYFIINCA